MAFTTTLLTCMFSPTTYRYARQCKSSSRFHRYSHRLCALLTRQIRGAIPRGRAATALLSLRGQVCLPMLQVQSLSCLIRRLCFDVATTAVRV